MSLSTTLLLSSHVAVVMHCPPSSQRNGGNVLPACIASQLEHSRLLAVLSTLCQSLGQDSTSRQALRIQPRDRRTGAWASGHVVPKVAQPGVVVILAVFLGPLQARPSWAHFSICDWVRAEQVAWLDLNKTANINIVADFPRVHLAPHTPTYSRHAARTLAGTQAPCIIS